MVDDESLARRTIKDLIANDQEIEIRSFLLRRQLGVPVQIPPTAVGGCFQILSTERHVEETSKSHQRELSSRQGALRLGVTRTII